MTAAEQKSDLKHTLDTLMGKLWGVCWEDIVVNWEHYYGTTLYSVGLAERVTN